MHSQFVLGALVCVQIWADAGRIIPNNRTQHTPSAADILMDFIFPAVHY